jgi:hypothetical protein
MKSGEEGRPFMGKEACLFPHEGFPGCSSDQPFFAASRALRENCFFASRHGAKTQRENLGIFLARRRNDAAS